MVVDVAGWSGCNINEQAVFTVVPLTDGEVCLVVDDVLEAPEALVQFAVARSAEFAGDSGDAYPGLQLPLDTSFYQPLLEKFRRDWRHPLKMGRPVTDHAARLSLVTLAPEALKPLQKAPHIDGPLRKPNAVVAGVLYLFKDERLGGTAFYRERYHPRVDGSVEQWHGRRHRYFAGCAGYLVDDNDYFTKVAEVTPRYNRLILYPGHVFHSGVIRHPELLCADPLHGRLTLNLFIGCIRL
jgi:hypothetical protein